MYKFSLRRRVSKSALDAIPTKTRHVMKPCAEKKGHIDGENKMADLFVPLVCLKKLLKFSIT